MVSLAARASSSAAAQATSTTRRLSRRSSTSTEAAEKRPRAKSHSHYRSTISGWISGGLDSEDVAGAAGEPGAKAKETGGAASTCARGATDDKAKPPAMAADAPAPSRAWGAPDDEEEPEVAAAPNTASRRDPFTGTRRRHPTITVMQ